MHKKIYQCPINYIFIGFLRIVFIVFRHVMKYPGALNIFLQIINCEKNIRITIFICVPGHDVFFIKSHNSL